MAARQFNRRSEAGNESVAGKICYDFVLEFTIFLCSIRDDAFWKIDGFQLFSIKKIITKKLNKLANKHNLSNAY